MRIFSESVQSNSLIYGDIFNKKYSLYKTPYHDRRFTKKLKQNTLHFDEIQEISIPELLLKYFTDTLMCVKLQTEILLACVVKSFLKLFVFV